MRKAAVISMTPKIASQMPTTVARPTRGQAGVGQDGDRGQQGEDAVGQ
jgi:hypothetical protein